MTWYWSPYLLCIAAAFLAGVSALPILQPGLGLRRWYQSLTLFAWTMMSGVVAATVVYSSPWLILGVIVVVLIAVSILQARSRLETHIDEEALSFLQLLIGLMASGQTMEQAMRFAAQDADFERNFPRMVVQTRTVMTDMDARKSFSEAAAQVAEIAPGLSRQVWTEITSLARLIEEEGSSLAAEAQRDTLQSLWAFLFEFHNLNRSLQRKMGQMELAKWIFTLILPGMNVYMIFMVPSYANSFLRSPIGMVVLGMEAAALVSIFVVFSRLQKLPEVTI